MAEINGNIVADRLGREIGALSVQLVMTQIELELTKKQLAEMSAAKKEGPSPQE